MAAIAGAPPPEPPPGAKAKMPPSVDEPPPSLPETLVETGAASAGAAGPGTAAWNWNVNVMSMAFMAVKMRAVEAQLGEAADKLVAATAGQARRNMCGQMARKTWNGKQRLASQRS